MARGDQLARQWKIIQTLIASQRGKSAPELAQNLGCHARTVYRDLEALQVAGFPVYTVREEGRSLWRLLDTAKQQIPIPFSITELMALYFSRGMMQVLKGTVFYDSLVALFEKIKTTMSPQYLHYLERVENSFEVGAKPYKPYGKFGDIIATVSQAVVQKKVVEMVYYTMSRKKQSRRRVAPYKIRFVDGTFYLIGHCGLRRQVRIFALDRIKRVRLTDVHFQVPEGFNPEEFMQSSFGVFHGAPVSVRIRFAPAIAGYISEKIWHATQKIYPQKDGSILFEARVAGTAEIKFWILRWGAAAQVLCPASLREEIRLEAAAMVQNYGT